MPPVVIDKGHALLIRCETIKGGVLAYVQDELCTHGEEVDDDRPLTDATSPLDHIEVHHDCRKGSPGEDWLIKHTDHMRKVPLH